MLYAKTTNIILAMICSLWNHNNKNCTTKHSPTIKLYIFIVIKQYIMIKRRGQPKIDE